MFRGFGSRMFVLCECLWATSTFFLGHTARRWWSCWGFLLLNKTIVSIITLPLVAEIYDSMDEQWWTTSKNIRKKKGTSEHIVNIYVGLMHVFIMLYLKNVFFLTTSPWFICSDLIAGGAESHNGHRHPAGDQKGWENLGEPIELRIFHEFSMVFRLV